MTPLMFTALHGEIEWFEALCKIPGVDFNQQDPAGRTALHFACARGRPDFVEAIVKNAGPELNLDLKTIGGETPLMKAAARNQVHCVISLLQFRANPLHENCFRQTAYDICCESEIISDLD